MNQSNKEYLDVLIGAGVKYFQKEAASNLFENDNLSHFKNSKVSKNSLSSIYTIENLVKYLDLYQNPLKKNAKVSYVLPYNILE